jgi:hypothetical protein
MDLSTGKQLENLVRNGALAPRQAGKAGLEVFPHGEEREDLAPLRDVGDAEAGTLVCLDPGEVAIPSTMAPREIGRWPTMARRSEVLPTPFRPSTHVTSPWRTSSDTPRSACEAP